MEMNTSMNAVCKQEAINESFEMVISNVIILPTYMNKCYTILKRAARGYLARKDLRRCAWNSIKSEFCFKFLEKRIEDILSKEVKIKLERFGEFVFPESKFSPLGGEYRAAVILDDGSYYEGE